MLFLCLFAFLYIMVGFAYGTYLDSRTNVSPPWVLVFGVIWGIALPIHIAISIGRRIGNVFVRTL